MNDLWYYVRNGQRMPPVSLAELKRLVADGTVQPTDLIWTAGLAEWVRAETVAELFPRREKPASSQKPQEASFLRVQDEPIGRSRRRRDDDGEARVVSRRLADEEDEGERYRRRYKDEEEDRPRRRRQQSNLGPILAIAGGGLGLIILVVVVIVVVSNLTQETGKRSWSLRKGEATSYRITFKANHKVEIWVDSNNNSDVDLFVFDDKGNRVVIDEGDSKDCYVWFIPPTTQTYKVEVQNRVRLEPHLQWRNGPNSGTLRFQETPVGGGAPVGKNPIVGGGAPVGKNPIPVNDPLIPLAVGGVHLGQITAQDRDPRFPNRFAKVYAYNMNAGQLYIITLESQVFDAYLRLEDNQGNILAMDDDGAGNLNSRITYRPERSDRYRIVVTSLGGNQLGQYLLRIEP